MKPNLVITLIAFITTSVAAVAQDNSSTNAGAVPPATVVVTNDATQSANNTATAAVTTSAPSSNEVAPSGGNAVSATETAQATVSSSGAAPQPGTIPLIVMDDVALTDAIQNLARQANLNYLLDPKISFGAPGADGRPVQPHVSIRWENITPQQALLALLNNYDLQLLEDPKTGIARITAKDPAALPPLMTKIFQLSYANPSNVVVAVQSALDPKRSKVLPDVRTSQLIVIATETELDEVGKMVKSLDTPTKQVLIEARMLEIAQNPKTSKGIDWSGTLANQHITSGNNALPTLPPQPAIPGSSTTPPTPTVPATQGTIGGILSGVGGGSGFLGSLNRGAFLTPNTMFLNADGVSAVLSFLNTSADAKVLSTPRAVTLDNETAVLSVTRATPILNVTAGTANTTGGSQITYTNLGVILNVTPRISANNYINLKVVPEVSRVFDTVSKIVNGQTFQADEYDIRRIQTQVMIPSGNTLVLGGLVQDDLRNAGTKVPLLGDIPGLGAVFRSNSKSRQKSDLIIFITPTIVQLEDFQPTDSNFLKTPVKAVDSAATGEWSAFDSTKPRDWSKRSSSKGDAYESPK